MALIKRNTAFTVVFMAVLAAAIVAVFVLSVSAVNNMSVFSSRNVCNIEQVASGSSAIPLPSRLDGEYGDTETVCFDAEWKAGDVIIVHTNYAPVTVYVGDMELMRVSYEIRGQWGIKNSSQWAVFRLPDGVTSGSVTLELLINGSKSDAELYEIVVGNPGDAGLQLICDGALSLFLNVFFLLLDAILLALAAVSALRYRADNCLQYLWLALFIALVNLWEFADGPASAVIAEGALWCFILNMMGYLLLPLPFVMYVRSFVKHRALMNVCAAVAALPSVIGAVSLVFGFFRLNHLLMLSHICIATVIILVMAVLLRGYRRKNRQFSYMALFTMLAGLGICGFMSMFSFYFSTDPDNLSFFRIGVIVFIIVLTCEVLYRSFKVFAAAEGVDQLKKREEEYRIAAAHTATFIARYDIAGKTLYQQSDVAAFFGNACIINGIPESLFASGAVAVESRDEFAAFFGKIDGGSEKGSAVCRMRTGEGVFRWFRMDYTAVFGKNGAAEQAIISLYDITDRREKEYAYEKWLQSYTAKDTATIKYCEYNLTSDRLEKEDGGLFPDIPEDVPRSLSAFISFIAKNRIYVDDRAKCLEFFKKEQLEKLYSDGSNYSETELRRMSSTGEPMWMRASVQTVPDPYTLDVKCFILLEDIDDRKRHELLLDARSTEDPLTGLLNRTAFGERCAASLSEDGFHALVIIDLDFFKSVNDTFGHVFGDSVLVEVADNIRSVLKKNDFASRLGGDEYIIMLHGAGDEISVGSRMQTLCELIEHSYGEGVSISASIGVALFPRDGRSFDELYRRADAALYRAKRNGRNRYCIAQPGDGDAGETAKFAETRENSGNEEFVSRYDTLLIAGGGNESRTFFSHLFMKDYRLLVAGDRNSAMRLLRENGGTVAAAIVDLRGFKDGMKMLSEISDDSYLRTVPVVAVCGADDDFDAAIKAGAYDCITDASNAEIAAVRVKNAVIRRRGEEQSAMERYKRLRQEKNGKKNS